jgi:hypothetical protein
MIVSGCILLRMRNLSDKSCRENEKTHISCSITFFSEIRAVYEIMWKKYCRAGQATVDIIRRMRIACWIPKATNTHSEYVILIAFPPQQWLHERASMLRYTYIAACLAPTHVCVHLLVLQII